MTGNLFRRVDIQFILRLLMAAMFIESFIDKLAHWNFYQDQVGQMGIPFPPFALAGAVLFEIFGSMSLVTGFAIRYGASMLAVYVFMLGFFYFDFWNQTGTAAIMARKEFLKDLAVISGLLLLARDGMSNREP